MSDPVTENNANSKQARRLARRWSRQQARSQTRDTRQPPASEPTESKLSESTQPQAAFDETSGNSVSSPEAPSEIRTELHPPAAAPANGDAHIAPVAQKKVDVSMIALDQCIERPFPPALRDSRRNGFQVVVHQSALNGIIAHAESRTDVEICGVLVGDIFRDDAGAYLEIDAGIAGAAAASHVANVTFTADTWQQIQAEMDHFHSGKKIVGWYHSHPDFGIFLSKMDLFIHENFFNLPWQVAFVRDPVRREDGLFVWREGVAATEEFLVDARNGARDDAPPQEAVEPGAGGIMPQGEVASPIAASQPNNVSHLIAAALQPSPWQAPAPDSAASVQSSMQTPHLSNPMERFAPAGPQAFGGHHEINPMTEIAMRLRRIERRQRSLAVALVVGLLMVLAWPLIVMTLMNDRSPTVVPHQPDSQQSSSGPSSSMPAPNPLTAQVSAHPKTMPAAHADAHKFAEPRWLTNVFPARPHAATTHPAAIAKSTKPNAKPTVNLGDAAEIAHATIPPAANPVKPAAPAATPVAAKATPMASPASRPPIQTATASPSNRSQTQPVPAPNYSNDSSDDEELPVRMNPNGGGGAKVIEVDH